MLRRSRYLIFLSLLVFSLIALGSPVLSQAQCQLPYWTEAAQPTIARQELYPEVLNGKIYVAGGFLSQNPGFTDHFESYDPVNDAWTQLRSLPEARHHITLSAVRGLLYGIGGFTGGFPDWRAQPTMFIYNPASNTWTQGIDLPEARAEAISTVVNDKIYLIGGRVRATDDARLFNDHIDSVRNEVFDPTINRWATLADAPTARNSAASAVIDGKIYVVGGRNFVRNADGTTQQVNVPNLEVYDPQLDRWEARSPMPQAQGGLAATALNGKLYVFGGEQWVPDQKVFAESWVYDPQTEVWEALPPLPTPRHGLGASAVGNRIFVFGGGTQTGGNAATAIHEVLVLPTEGARLSIKSHCTQMRRVGFQLANVSSAPIRKFVPTKPLCNEVTQSPATLSFGLFQAKNNFVMTIAEYIYELSQHLRRFSSLEPFQ